MFEEFRNDDHFCFTASACAMNKHRKPAAPKIM